MPARRGRFVLMCQRFLYGFGHRCSYWLGLRPLQVGAPSTVERPLRDLRNDVRHLLAEQTPHRRVLLQRGPILLEELVSAALARTAVRRFAHRSSGTEVATATREAAIASASATRVVRTRAVARRDSVSASRGRAELRRAAPVGF